MWLECAADEIIGADLTDVIGAQNAKVVDEARRLPWVQRHDELDLIIDGRPFTGTLTPVRRLAWSSNWSRSPPTRVWPRSCARRPWRCSCRGRVVDVAEQAATWVRELTGFDRVMVYRFDDDWNGEVIAEAKLDSLNTFLGLHYPATDIPAQARELYRRNWLRMHPRHPLHAGAAGPTGGLRHRPTAST